MIAPIVKVEQEKKAKKVKPETKKEKKVKEEKVKAKTVKEKKVNEKKVKEPTKVCYMTGDSVMPQCHYCMKVKGLVSTQDYRIVYFH